MPLKDLSGKTVYDLEREDFERLFCYHCRYRGTQYCEHPETEINFCKRFVDCGFWDRVYRKN